METLDMKTTRLWALLLCAASPVSFATAQFVDLNAQIEVSEWSRTAVRTWTTPIHCVIGTNSWLMDGDFNSNAKVRYRFTGTNIEEDSVITKAPSEELLKHLKQAGMPAGMAAAIGTRSKRTFESVDGNPGRTVRQMDAMWMVPRIGWLAFCSGPCLRREGRALFPPNDLWKELVRATSFQDRTAVFDDPLGLPKSVNLFTTDQQQVMQYRVVSSTNVLGCQIPTEFVLAQYRTAPTLESQHIWAGTNGWELDFIAKGKVKTVTETKALESLDTTPDEVAPGNR
jgi:hypothetical protein